MSRKMLIVGWIGLIPAGVFVWFSYELGFRRGSGDGLNPPFAIESKPSPIESGLIIASDYRFTSRDAEFLYVRVQQLAKANYDMTLESLELRRQINELKKKEETK